MGTVLLPRHESVRSFAQLALSCFALDRSSLCLPGSAAPILRASRRFLTAAIACAVLAPFVANGAPSVFEETAKIHSPDPEFSFPLRVAVEGDTIIATGRKFVGPIEHHAAFLFRRQSNGDWVYVSTLAQSSCDSGEAAEDTCTASVAIRDGVAVVSANHVHVFTRQTNGSWVAAPSEGSSGPGDAAVGTDTVFTGEMAGCDASSQSLRKNSAGVWSVVATFPGAQYPGCDSWGLVGGDVDASAGNRLIVGAAPYDSNAVIYEPSGPGWTQTAHLTSPIDGYAFGDTVAMDDSRAFVSGTIDTPIHAYSRSSGAWTHVTDIVPPDAAQLGWPNAIKVRDLVVAGFGSVSHDSGSVRVFRETASGEYEQVARLVGSDSSSQWQFGSGDVDVDVDGSFARIIAAGGGALYVFDLDDWGTTPAPIQTNFEQGNAASWTPMAGSAFSVVTSGGTYVYRQSNFTGDAGSFLNTIDWTNQAIEADVKPTAFNSPNSWVGLAVRRTDASNYYYVTLRKTNLLEIKRMANGNFVTLISSPVPMALNRTYRVRLEAIGTHLRAYVDGRLIAQTHDSTLSHGHTGLRMWKARADFDNVILSHNSHLTLLDQRNYRLLQYRWSLGPGTWSEGFSNENQNLIQHDMSGDARAIALVPADDQIVQVRATANAFASGSGSRWFGVLARYVDANNYYYVTVRRDNTISLRKLVNGAIHVLDSATLTVTPGTWYDLRLEAIGSSLRAYVNGQLVLEATDTAHVRGRYGAVTYKTAATYDDFLVWEP